MFQLGLASYEAALTTKATSNWSWLEGVVQTTEQYRLDSTGLVGSEG
jgi:hypothetical protein